MSYFINTEADLQGRTLGELESFLQADKVNAAYGRDLMVNPTLELELIYQPVGYVCNGA
ncbi:hypothetical protein [Nonomuraea jabiensis]|uniref:hypothetical protein n=1 Tax=Nonomuraea jabiensis TaxID=882448 RepID=UPI003D73C1B9